MNVKFNSALENNSRVPKRKPRQPPARSEQRAAEVTRTAGRLFLRHGFNGVSLEMIVSETGGSYREIYNEFGGKEALFKKVMKQRCAEILAPLRQALAGSELQRLPLREALTLLGGSILKVLLAPPGLAFHRLMVSEAARFPELAKEFYRAGPAHAHADVAAFLSARAQQERLSLEDFEAAAAIFVESLVSPLQLKALTSSRVPQSEVENHVRQAVRIFLNGAVRRP